VIGGIAGAAIGSRIATGRSQYGYNGGANTTGALIGGALGAVVGSKVVGRNC